MANRVQTNSHFVHELTESDRDLIMRTPLTHGEAEIEQTLNSHEVCIMQLTSMLLTAPKRRISEDTVEYDHYEGMYVSKILDEEAYAYSDHPPCVSEVITDYMIELNDSLDDAGRERLRDLVPEIIDTCPIKITTRNVGVRGTNTQWIIEEETRDATAEYDAAERERTRILDAASDRAADAAGLALKLEIKLDGVRQAAAVR